MAVQKPGGTLKYCGTEDKPCKHPHLIWKSRGLALLNTVFCLIPLQIRLANLLDSLDVISEMIVGTE